jgi:hypothetical protein
MEQKLTDERERNKEIKYVIRLIVIGREGAVGSPHLVLLNTGSVKCSLMDSFAGPESPDP